MCWINQFIFKFDEYWLCKEYNYCRFASSGGGIDMMHIMIYACSNLLPVITVDMVQHQAVQLGGLH